MKLCSLISPQRLSSLQKMALSVGSGIPKKWLPPSRLPFALSSLLPSSLSFCSVSCIEAPLRLSRLVGYIVRCIYYHRHATSSCIPVLEDGACTISSEYEDFDQTSYSACQWPRVSCPLDRQPSPLATPCACLPGPPVEVLFLDSHYTPYNTYDVTAPKHASYASPRRPGDYHF